VELALPLYCHWLSGGARNDAHRVRSRADAWHLRRRDAGEIRGQRVADAEETEEPFRGTGWLVSDYLVSGRQSEPMRRTAYAQGRATNHGGDTRGPATEETFEKVVDWM
jgi:hypothetical protein